MTEEEKFIALARKEYLLYLAGESKPDTPTSWRMFLWAFRAGYQNHMIGN